MADAFQYKDPQLGDPASRHYVVSPSNTVDLPFRPRALYVQSGTAVAIRDELGNDITYTVVAGQILPFRGVRVLATGTNATLVAWY